MKHIFDIVAFGAQPDGSAASTVAIQKAINACHEAGGGRVLCGPGRFLIGSLTLRSNVELHVTAGCKLVGSTSLDDYEDLSAPGFNGERAPDRGTKALVRAVEARNVAITGPGEIDGRGPAFYDTARRMGPFFAKPATQRPLMVMLYRCHDVRLEDTSFTDSPLWTFWLMRCERVTVQRIRVAGDQRMINNDGIDLDACRDVTVADSIFKTGDDCVVLRAIQQVHGAPAVCENVTVSNCVLDSWCQGVRVGCPGDGVIRNCTFSNLVINSRHNGILFENPKCYLPPDGRGTADVQNILFSTVVINCARMPIGVIVEDGIALPRLAGLSFSDFRIRSGEPCVVSGCPETTIRDVNFSNVTIETTGEDAIVCRHCEGVKLTNVELSNRPGRA